MKPSVPRSVAGSPVATEVLPAGGLDGRAVEQQHHTFALLDSPDGGEPGFARRLWRCLLYTSDAADEL